MATVSEDINEGVMKELECAVCLDFMQPPIILICNNGHSVCNKCAPQLQSCPTCKVAAISIRNIGMEKIAQKVLFPCTNSKWGCDQKLVVDSIANHQTECFHSNRNCPWAPPYGQCEWKGSTSDLKAHFTSSHADRTVAVAGGAKVDLSLSTSGTKKLFPQKIITAFDEMFLQCSIFTDNNFYCILQYVGAKKDCANFKYKFSVSRRNGIEKISMSHVVCSDTDDLNQIRDSGDCIRLPYELLKPYCAEVEADDSYSLFPCLKYSIKISERA